MRTGERVAGRAIALIAAAFGLVYLGWRVTSTLHGAPFWLAATTLVVEIAAFLVVVVLVWALWADPLHRHGAGPIASAASPDEAWGQAHASLLDVEVVVRCSGQGIEMLRATLLATRNLGPVAVLDLEARSEVASLALETGARYVATDADDHDGLVLAVQSSVHTNLLLLDAGDIPHPAIIEVLEPYLDDPTVAVVQGVLVPSRHESAEHGTGGRHDAEFERLALGPSLGARGVAPFTGSGALVRRAAVDSVQAGCASREMVQAQVTAGLFAAGWQIVSAGPMPLVAVAPIEQPEAVESIRAREASAAMHRLVGENGALRINRLTLSQRLALIATSVRPLSGIRRSVTIVILLASMLSGALPFDPSTAGLVGLWVPWFVCSALGLWSLSNGRLRPGDRLRHSMRVLGASWRGALAPDGRPDDPQHTLAGAFGLSHGVATAAAVGAISVVIGLRGMSDRVTHTLEPMSIDETAGVLVVALWTLAGALDALRLLGRKAQARRATRVTSSLPCTFAEHAALVVDLTSHGAGVICDAAVDVGGAHDLDVVMPTASGCVSATVPVVVRNSRADVLGARRVGVEFGPMEPYLADALAEFCVVQPALEVLGAAALDPTIAEVRPLTVVDDGPASPRRIGLRAAALVAVAGALASAVPSSAEASGPVTTVVRGQVVVGEGAAASDPTVPDTSPADTSSPDTSTADTSSPDTSTVDTSTAAASSADTVSEQTVAVATVPVDPGPATAGAAGALVTVVCSISAGADEAFGTSDDVYGAPVTVLVGADGTYAVPVAGDACWATVAAPTGFMLPGETADGESRSDPHVVDLGTGQIESVELVATTAAEVRSGSATIADVVWADLDADGVVDAGEGFVPGVTVTLFRDGTAVDSRVTDDAGRFSFDGLPEAAYSLGASNLPDGLVTAGVLGRTTTFAVSESTDLNVAIGLRPIGAPVVGAEATPGVPSSGIAQSKRLLVEPATSALADHGDGRSPVGVAVVVLLATIIGLSVLVGSVRPRPLPAGRRQSVSSPPLAIR